MKAEIYTNEYGYERAKCPFCEIEVYTRPNNSNPDKLRYLKRHIITEAKSEALNVVLGDKNKMKHLEYVKSHTELYVKPSIVSKYKFDSDLNE